MWFEDRTDAGQKLAPLLQKFKMEQPVVLAVPRGGVIVGGEVARDLQIPLDILIVRKIGAPFNPEVAIGAVLPDGSAVLDTVLIKKANIADQYIKQVIEEQTAEIRRRQRLYKGTEEMPLLADKTVIIVDDGIATGYTMEAAILGLRKYKPQAIIVAVPVAPREIVERLQKVADEVVCLDTPEPFFAVGQFYQNFTQTSDDEVIRILQKRAEAKQGNFL